MKFLWKYVRKNKLSFMLSFLLVGVSVAAMLIQPSIMGSIIDAVARGDIDNITTYGLILVGIALVGLVSGILNTILAARIAQRTGSDIRLELFDKVNEFSYSNIEKFSASNLVVRLTNDSAQAQNLIMILLQTLTRIPIMFVGSLILAMTTIPQLWWIVVLVVILVFAAVMVSFGMMGPKFGKIQMYLERINAIAKENFMGMRVVKSFVQEESEIEKFTKESQMLTKETISVGYIFGLLIPSFFFIMDGGNALALLLVGVLVETDPSIIGASVSFTSYLVMVMMSLMIGGMMVSFSSRAFVSIARIKEVLDTEPDMTFENNDIVLNSGNIEFENVSFVYDGDEEETLRNVSFSINQNETIGVVGATGSGKSTLAQLIARIFDPSEGRILIDDTDLKDLSNEELRKNVSIVLQRPTLFSGTIADNIRHGKRDASYEEMSWAAKIAQAEKFILEEEGGFDAEVYQRGANFSGGQKQRISIARGLVGNPKVLILDDSTSALDAHSEKLVKEALINDLVDTTKVIVSQKISSIVQADKILVLDKGKLVASGTHKELLVSSPTYVEIFETQKGKAEFDYELN